MDGSRDVVFRDADFRDADFRDDGIRVLMRRAGRVESEHRVHVAVWRDGRLTGAAGDVNSPKSCVISSGAPIAVRLNKLEIAP